MTIPRNLGVVGLGIMGASLARAARAAQGAVHITAVETVAEIRRRALSEGVADVVLAEPGGELGRCQMVVLCTPVASIEELLGPVSRMVPDGAILTDVGGAKERLVAAARARMRPGISFVGAHPMFGGSGGYAAARRDLWRGGTIAICTDGAPSEAVERVVDLHRALGAEVVQCSAAEHDAAVAAVSHLPHLVAGALALAVREAGPLAARLGRPGIDDMTRRAGFAFDLQGELARHNAHLPEAVQRLERHLERLLAAIADSPRAAQAVFEEARAAREELS